MLKWFGAGVGCTTAIAFGLYSLHNGGSNDPAPSNVSFELPLERDDSAPVAGGMDVAPRPVIVHRGSAPTQTATKYGTVRIIPSNGKAERRKSAVAAKVGSSQTAVGNGWTLRFVSSGSTASAPKATRTRTAGSNNERTALAKSIQQEMRRAGCSTKIYTHGYWDNTTRTAAIRFVRNRNSAIPTSRPDEALLSMLKNYRGSQCGLSTVAKRPAPQRRVRLKQPPRLATRSQNNAITTGWITQTSPARMAGEYANRRRTTYANAIRPSSGRTSLRVAPSTSADAASRNYLANGRMALGARSYSGQGQPAAPQGIAPLTVRPNGTFGPTDLSRGDNYIAPRYDAERAEALRQELREAQRRAKKANARKRRTAKRRYYRRRRSSNWRAQAFSPER
ncbi:MAG: hypothetical protein AAF346_04565 [Pseudomonadota bacterium]